MMTVLDIDVLCKSPVNVNSVRLLLLTSNVSPGPRQRSDDPTKGFREAETRVHPQGSAHFEYPHTKCVSARPGSDLVCAAESE